MSVGFEQTALWTRTLAPQPPHDPHDKARERLRDAYLRMRKQASELVNLIPQDCRGLTVHDITHLDALWDIADIIAGPDFPMNPAEAFVFGASVLIHDSAMSVAAYPGGMAEITGTVEWKDAAHAAFRRRDIEEPDDDLLSNPPKEIKDEVIFTVLRALHARQAEKLIAAKWHLPSTGEEVCLLEDIGLRNAYGASIGQIAHSHHWNLDLVARELRRNFGGAADLPGEWTVNEIKVACLLRCADAAHIDHRRAPSMLYALTRPNGISDLHWNFQNKLNKPIRQADRLLYSSGQEFEIHEAPAWWLCFDTIKMINRELGSASALLQDIGAPKFAATRVIGAESPDVLAHQIRPRGWRPVNAEVRASDPVALAHTLGGSQLYGPGAYAPIRELLQNAVDAVRARRRIEDRDINWGVVRLTLEKSPEPSEEIWLHVDDNGVGMSERILVGPLLDLGKSLWRSSLLHNEFPGLESLGFRPIGKFGIGFFSVFLLGRVVRVVTKPYDGGAGDIKALEFSSIESRPILRDALPEELPVDFSTRVSVRIDDLDAVSERGGRYELYRFREEVGDERETIHMIFKGRIRRLLAALDIKVDVNDYIANCQYTHKANWENSPARDFLEELLSEYSPHDRERYISAHEHSMSKFVVSPGNKVGRAALFLLDSRSRRLRTSPAFVSAGGLVHGRYRGGPGYGDLPYIGVFPGDTREVTRRSAVLDVPTQVISDWASEQARSINQSRYQVYDLIRASHAILYIGGDPGQLPFFFQEGGFKPYSQFLDMARYARNLCVPLFKSYRENFEPVRVVSLTAAYFVHTPIPELIVVETESDPELFEEKLGKEIFQCGGRDILMEELTEEFLATAVGRLILDKLDQIWDQGYSIRIEKRQVFQDNFVDPPSPEWVMTLDRSV